MRTSYKKNRPFDFKLIDNVQPYTVLYKRQTGLSNYDVMKTKTEIWSKIAEIMNCDVGFCLMRWNNLYYQYRKESRRATGTTWPYFERLGFLSDTKSRPKARPRAECSPSVPLRSEQQPDTVEIAEESFANQSTWQSYNDCVVLHVNEIEQHADSTFVIEEIIESNEQSLQEEIIYEEEEQLQCEQLPPASEERMVELLELPGSDYQKMDTVLRQLQGDGKRRAERRIMAFVLKCQLRSLVNEPIDDLVI